MKTWCAILLLPALAMVFVARAAEFPEPKDSLIQTNLPDVMTMADGTKVRTVAQWRQRREQMKAILEYYELGHAPPPPGNVSGEVIQSRTLRDSSVKYRLVHLKFGPKQQCGFDIAIYTPARGGPFPTIINPAFFMTPGVSNSLLPRASAVRSPPRKPAVAHPFITPERGAEMFSQPLARGYAIVTYLYTECGEDNSNCMKSAYYPAYPGFDWGLLRGWAWGLSRVVDYLETQSFADKTKLIALGHSRIGKFVMVAAAFDDRIALAAPAGSGCAGAGAYRFCGPGRGGKQGIGSIIKNAPYYFVPRFREFAGHVDRLPFDEHWLVALTAPRPWIAIEATKDQYCVPNSVKQTILAAQPDYVFLGANPDRATANYEPHRHALTPEDWNAALDFADQQLRGINHHRTFGNFPTEENSTPAATPKPFNN